MFEILGEIKIGKNNLGIRHFQLYKKDKMMYNICRIKVKEIYKMLEIIKERTIRTEKSYWINFDCKDDHSCGFIFPANSDGTPALDKMPEEAKMNYYACEASTNKFDRWFEEREDQVVDYAVGKCKCGHEVELFDGAWMGAVQCENCGKWYNIYGQELVDPEYWEEDDEDYYDSGDDYWE